MLEQDRKRLINAILFTAFFLIVIWGVFVINEEGGFQLKQFGVRPRKLKGLIGIFTHPFLHGDYEHIWHNTLSFAVLNTFLFYFYRSIALKAFGIIFLFTGVLLWIIGVSGNHIGASGVIYGLASFLFFSGIFRGNLNMLRVSLVVAFLYGSLVWYVLPIVSQGISWEGHLSGAIIGVVAALAFKEEGPERDRYKWEIEEELEEMMLNRDEIDLSNLGKENEVASTGQRQIIYHYKQTPKADPEDLA